MKIKLWVDTGFPNAKHVDIFEDDLNLDDAELDEVAETFMLNNIDWGWERVE